MVRYRRDHCRRTVVVAPDGAAHVAWPRLVLALLIGIGAAAPAWPEDAPPAPETLPMTGLAVAELAVFDRTMTDLMQQQKLFGGALAVARNGRLMLSRGYGWADVAARQAVQPVSLFRIASISKPITAVAVLQLVERGKLKLDDKPFDLLPYARMRYANAKPDARLSQITVLQLLHHTGGWSWDNSPDPMFRTVEIARALGKRPPAGPRDIVRYMAGQPLDFDPGARHAYSNFGYCLLGRVIERVSGQAYEQYVQEQVLQPLGLTDMRLGKTLLADRAKNEVRYYEAGDRRATAVVGPDFGKPVPQPYGAWWHETLDAHGGWIASAEDLVRFAAAFDNPAQCPVLNAVSVALMFARPPGAAGFEPNGAPKEVFYACGWSVRPVGPEAAGRANHWHAGSLPATATLLVRRYDGLIWAALFNTCNATAQSEPITAIDARLHKAADSVAGWPAGAALYPEK